MKKVVQVVTHFDMGGAERIAINIAKSKSGFEYHMIEVASGCSDFSVEFKKEMEESDIIYHCATAKKNKIGLLYFPFRFRSLIKQISPDVIQTHTENPDLGVYLTYLLFPHLFKNIKIVRTLHNTVLWQNWKFIGKVVERFFVKKRANVSNSNMISEVYQREYGYDPNIKLIYNGFEPVVQVPYDKLIQGKKNVLFAGRFHSQKGLPVLIETIKRVDPNIYHFHIAGKGELEKELYEGLKDKTNVTISGPIFGLSKYLSCFDYVFIPSVHEGLNSLSIESSFSHTPVIINNCDGLNETVPKEYPLKVNNNSVEEYVNLFKMIEQEDNIRYADMTFKYATEHFSISKMQSEYEALYEN